MFTPFFEGLLLGFGAAIPLGPINILIMTQALREYKKAVVIGFGAMSADVTYLLLILYGIIHYIQNKQIFQILSILGALFLIYLGYQIYKNENQSIHKPHIEQRSSVYSSYLKGYLLTLLNPYTILFWLSTTTYSTSTQSLTLTVVGMITAITLWVTIMPYFVHSKKHMISTKTFSYISIASAGILLFFGFALLYKTFFN